MENYLKQYVSFRNRLEKFCTATDYETQKTYANTAALLDRAELLTTGATPHGRFGCDGGVTVQTLTARALSYIEALERGEFPLKGKFSPPGEWIADHSVVVKGEEVHIFFNKHAIGYEWAQRPCRSFGHIVSTDLKNWETLPNVLACENGGPDSYQIWSPSVVEKDGTYYMIYTGVNYEMAQSACLAWSTDLITWEKCPQNPVFTPPPSWSDWKETSWSDCRDHFVYHDGEQYVMLYAKNGERRKGALLRHCLFNRPVFLDGRRHLSHVRPKASVRIPLLYPLAGQGLLFIHQLRRWHVLFGWHAAKSSFRSPDAYGNRAAQRPCFRSFLRGNFHLLR